MRSLDLLRRVSGGRTTTAPKSASRRICLDMAGDFLGRMTVALFTTGLPRVPMANLGVSARNWCGGTSKKSIGRASTMPISKRTMPPDISRERCMKGTARRRWRCEAVHFASGWRGVALRCQRTEGWSFARALRATGIAVRQSAVSASKTNPAVDRKKRPDNPYAAPHDARFPYVLSTYRLTEQHTAGGMTRYLSHLA